MIYRVAIPTEPCAHCPVGPACPALARRVGRYCVVVDPASPEHQPGMAAILIREADGPAATPFAPTDIGPLMRVATCPSRHSDCHCLSKPATCLLIGVVVDLADCLRCVNARS